MELQDGHGFPVRLTCWNSDHSPMNGTPRALGIEVCAIGLLLFSDMHLPRRFPNMADGVEISTPLQILANPAIDHLVLFG
jgi:hypothetical protein